MRATMHKIILGCGLIFSLSAFNAPATFTEGRTIIPDICNAENSTFQGGETLTYKLYYNWGYLWLSAGEVTFNVKDVGNEFHLSAYGKTYKSYEWFFKVRDHYEAYVNKETLLPSRAYRSVQEGGYRLYEKIEYMQNANKVISTRGKTKEVARPTEYAVDNCMHDILSIIYYLRNVNTNEMQNGDSVPMKIFMDNKEWPLDLTLIGKKKSKKIKELGKFDVMHLVPKVIVGDIFNEGTVMNIYASDDGNRIPLLIESPVSVGSVKAVLKSHNGLKHDLSSKKK